LNVFLYNGFLAAGLMWGLIAYGVHAGRPILTFFLVCIVIAGVYGAFTVSRRILLIQAVPAVVAAGLLWLT
jgi:putative membrane protein